MSASLDQEGSELRGLGERIRSIRRLRGLRLDDVALRTGLSKSLLSMVERGRVNCPVGTLIGIANALRVPVAELFDDQSVEEQPVVPRERQRVIQVPEGERRVFALNRARRIEFSENIYRPGAKSAVKPISHAGWECGVLARGSLSVEVGGQGYDLHAGDCFAFASTRPHRFRNPGQEPSCLFWVNVYDDLVERRPGNGGGGA